jgi:HEAT repeat protein
VNHKNFLVRREAQIAIVKLTGFEGLEFLNVINHPISEWQQLRLIQELSGHASEKFGNISLWLQSRNESVINFALRLVEIYQQYDFYNEVKERLSHPSISICKRAVITLSHISNETTPDLLIEYFAGYDASLQILILKILQRDGNENHLPFLFSLLNHPDDSFKLEAAKAITNINPTKIKKIKELKDEFLYPWNIILPQIKMQNSL